MAAMTKCPKTTMMVCAVAWRVGQRGDADNCPPEDDDGYNDYDSDYEMKINAKKDGNAVDPYAGGRASCYAVFGAALTPPALIGIFFSKTRREEVVEVDEDPEYAVNKATGKTMLVMSRGDFMRGCPEASEQSHLFSLYNKASEPSRKCGQCGTNIPITKADFLAIFVSPIAGHVEFAFSSEFFTADFQPVHGRPQSFRHKILS